MLDVAEALPAVRETVEGHLQDRGLTRHRVLATAVRLLDLGFFRIGNDRYTELNNSYGLTTLLREHSRCQAGAVLFTYTGKHGKEIVQTVADPAACRRRMTAGWGRSSASMMMVNRLILAPLFRTF